jgi:PPOX class probable F420-dependent enzyme
MRGIHLRYDAQRYAAPGAAVVSQQLALSRQRDKQEETTMNGGPVEANDARAALRRAKTIVLSSYKRDGPAVATPVSLGFDGERLFFRSYDRAWKTKRIRNNPRVEVAPSTLRGKPTGDPVGARAVLLEGEEAKAASRALARGHRVLQRLLVPFAHRLARYQTMHYELHLDGGDSGPR